MSYQRKNSKRQSPSWNLTNFRKIGSFRSHWEPSIEQGSEIALKRRSVESKLSKIISATKELQSLTFGKQAHLDRFGALVLDKDPKSHSKGGQSKVSYQKIFFPSFSPSWNHWLSENRLIQITLGPGVGPQVRNYAQKNVSQKWDVQSQRV